VTSTFSTLVPVKICIPRLRKAFANTSATSASSNGTSVGNISIKVTRVP
jgi:hypothetical protein